MAKFVGFVFTGSSSMLAEGVHSLADTGNQVLLLLGGRRAKQAPTPSHPFGYGRERYFWAFVVAIVLFTLGSVFAIFEGIEKILHPHELESPGVAIAILLVAIVLEGFSFRTAVRESNPLRKGDVAGPQFIRRSKAPELPVRAARGLRRAGRPGHRPRRRRPRRRHRQRVWDGVGIAAHRRCCSASSPSCWPSR